MTDENNDRLAKEREKIKYKREEKKTATIVPKRLTEMDSRGWGKEREREREREQKEEKISQ